jgi:hypothetical protein
MIWFFAIMIVLSLFWQLENRRRIKRAEAHREKQEALMDLILKLKEKENTNENKGEENGTDA